MEPFKDPESTVELQIVALGKLAPPRIVNDHRCAELRRLDNCLNLATVLGPLSISFRKEEKRSDRRWLAGALLSLRV